MRRQETKKKNSQPFWKKEISFTKGVSKEARKPNLRFKISLVMLIALLSVSVLILLLTLVRDGNRRYYQAAGSTCSGGAKEKNWSGKVSPGKRTLDDESLDFKLTMPRQLGNWMYKIGYVKSPTDESLSDQYVRVYVPLSSTAGSNNFEKQYQDILTIRKFTSEEWKELEKGCDKKNLAYCAEAGTKITEKDEAVYAYAKAGKCPNEIAPKCVFIDEIIKSFRLD